MLGQRDLGGEHDRDGREQPARRGSRTAVSTAPIARPIAIHRTPPAVACSSCRSRHAPSAQRTPRRALRVRSHSAVNARPDARGGRRRRRAVPRAPIPRSRRAARRGRSRPRGPRRPRRSRRVAAARRRDRRRSRRAGCASARRARPVRPSHSAAEVSSARSEIGGVGAPVGGERADRAGRRRRPRRSASSPGRAGAGRRAAGRPGHPRPVAGSRSPAPSAALRTRANRTGSGAIRQRLHETWPLHRPAAQAVAVATRRC